jgi:hypothetical protein
MVGLAVPLRGTALANPARRLTQARMIGLLSCGLKSIWASGTARHTLAVLLTSLAYVAMACWKAGSTACETSAAGMAM